MNIQNGVSGFMMAKPRPRHGSSLANVATVMTLRPLSTLTMALGRAYGLRIFSISAAET